MYKKSMPIVVKTEMIYLRLDVLTLSVDIQEDKDDKMINSNILILKSLF